MMMKVRVAMLLATLAVALLAGCGAEVAGTPTRDVVNPDRVGDVTVSLLPEAGTRALSDRFLFEDVVVQFRRVSDNAVVRQAVLTLANPSVTFTGLPAGLVGYAYAAVRLAGVVFTDGRSSDVTIVAGKNVNASIVVTATEAEVKLVAPSSDGATVNTASPGLVVHVYDPGGKPVSGHLYRVTSGGVVVKDLGVRTGTNENLSWGDSGLSDGKHYYRLEASTASGGSSEFNFSLVVNTSGGLNIEISQRGGEE